MFEVKMVDHCAVHPLAKTEYAAKICYEGIFPEMRSGRDEATSKYVRENVFEPGHHTTLQHSLFSFQIEGIAVGDVTFGLHLVSPFYNSDQRSGRFCLEMFRNPDFDRIESYLRYFWPEVSPAKMNGVMSYVRGQLGRYQSNIDRATTLAGTLLRRERPFASAKLLASEEKIAQEQLRNFIPIVFPTGLVYSVTGSALIALWESAWTPVMRYVTDMMREEVLRLYPEERFFFDPKRRNAGEWSPEYDAYDDSDWVCLRDPNLNLDAVPNLTRLVVPGPDDTFNVDRLHFRPDFMVNSVEDISVRVHVSVATMGQDQRHRTIRRGDPKFTGGFYLPPIMDGLGLEAEATESLKAWRNLVADRDLPSTLVTILVPYGAMVSYRKKGSFNAVIHEQGKRLCWCAQQEIYELGRQLRESSRSGSGDERMSQMFEPLCFRTGKCAEGKRYCGRDISKRESGNYFPKRKV